LVIELPENEQKILEQCIVCDAWYHEGIHILDHFICRLCEGEMIRTDVTQVRYLHFVERMRRIWLEQPS
jgi:hypothetical protein